MFKRLKHFMPKGLLWRLTSLNIIVIALTITLIGWSVYETACSLAAAMGDFGEHRQRQFNATLFQYVLSFSLVGIVVGTVLHLNVTKKIIRPIKDLINSTKRMKQGDYPEPLHVHSEGELAHLVEHFNRMVEQLEKNESERKKLVTDLSHEIRTPLANLNGYLQALKSGVIEGETELYTSLYHEARRLTDMMDQLDQLKEWDQLPSNAISQSETIQIVHHIKQCVAMFQWKLDEKGIEIDLQIEPQQLNINPSGIQQVLSNIVQNAIQYYDGEGSIHINGKQLKDTPFYKISVAGPGELISEAEQAQLFERFYRIDSSRSRQTGGSGLGLAIAKEIVEHHNGQMGIQSEEQLNTVWFMLPIE